MFQTIHLKTGIKRNHEGGQVKSAKGKSRFWTYKYPLIVRVLWLAEKSTVWTKTLEAPLETVSFRSFKWNVLTVNNK